MLIRRTGFVDYIGEHYPDTVIENVFIDPMDRDSIDATLDAVFKGVVGEKFIVMFNSRVHLVADYIRRKGLKDCRVVGYDVLDKILISCGHTVTQAPHKLQKSKLVSALPSTISTALHGQTS